MKGEVLRLAQARPDADDVIKGLRNLADSIEAGDVDFPPTTVVVLLGHSELGSPGRPGATYWRTYGLGPRHDGLTVRGIMASAMTRWESGPQ